jgi:nucleoside-diphosphate-sugar epimerase
MHQCIVTGSSGFVGNSLLRSLADSGYSGLAVSRSGKVATPHGWESCKREQLLGSGYRSGPHSTLIHLEVKQHVANPSAEDLAAFDRVNVNGTSEWLKFAALHRIQRFVHFSSIKAVAGSGACLDESGTLPGGTPYGRSKWKSEQLVSEWSLECPERTAIILRPAVVYGPGNVGNMLAMTRAIETGSFMLVGGGANIKSVLGMTNLCSATKHLMQRSGRGCEVYNLTDAQSYTVKELAEMIALLLGRKRRILSIPWSVANVLAMAGDGLAAIGWKATPFTSNTLKGLTEISHFSCGKLLETGFVHCLTTFEGLKEMIMWHKESHSASELKPSQF